MSNFINTSGIYPWSPGHGTQLVHPDDLERFTKLFPRERVFQAVDERDGYLTLKYGTESFRVRPDLYRPVTGVAFRIGDLVEVSGAQPPKSGVIGEVNWHFKNREPIYYLSFNGKPSSRRYSPGELLPHSPEGRITKEPA